jgi:hypothetical protein
MIAKYHVTAHEMIAVVKKLIGEGLITKNDYLGRKQKIEEFEARQEQEFLQSLFQCPVCGHIHPIPFTRCPACETDISDREETQMWYQLQSGPSPIASKPKKTAKSAKAAKADTLPKPAKPAKPKKAAKPTPAPPPEPEPEPEPQVPEDEIDEAYQAAVGVEVEDLEWLPDSPVHLYGNDYVISSVISGGDRAAVFKAESASGKLPLVVKLFNPDLGDQDQYDDILESIIRYQSNMNDPNVVQLLGTAQLASNRALVYDYLPTNIETLMAEYPEGLEYDRIEDILRQILNGLAYCHRHRGKDKVSRKVPHLSLRASRIQLDEGDAVVKIDDCGVTRAIIEARGHKKYLYDEPGIDPAYIAPECFVIKSRAVNVLYADIYSLGVILYKMTTGHMPFEGPQLKDYKFQHLSKYAIPPRVHRHTVPKWLDQMIMLCLEKEGKDRWRSATQMELAIGKEAPV